MINWPVPSYIGEIYTAPNGKSWEWNGYAWDFIGPDYAIGPTGPSQNKTYQVAILGESSVYETDCFWFSNTSEDYLSGTGSINLSVLSMEIDGDEKISSPTTISITGSTGPEDSWVSFSGKSTYFYGGTNAIIGERNLLSPPRTPIKWLSHLDSLGDNYGVKFSGITQITPNSISLENDTDFTLIIKRNAPDWLEQADYWYKWEYSSSTKIVTHQYSSSGASGPYISYSYSFKAFIGPFYR